MKIGRRLLPDISQFDLFAGKAVATGEPLVVRVELIDEDPHNPRTEFPDADIDELADDIRQQGLLQPIVVQLAGVAGRYRIRFGAKRLRAAIRAGLAEVPVTLCARSLDAYAQVAENQKRRGLSPLDLARFIHGRVDVGESNAVIAKRLGIDQTTIAHHLALLSLPPVLEQALRSGRCASPRTLCELSKLYADRPERVIELVQGSSEITRHAVAALRMPGIAAPLPPASTDRPSATTRLIARVNTLCVRIEKIIDDLKAQDADSGAADLPALRQRLADLAKR